MNLNPFRKKQKDFPLPKIFRTQVIEGVSIPGIIKNGSHFFVDLAVYEDGRVACWNFEDFEHFKKDVRRGWVSVSVPDGDNISISGLGEWEINAGSWLYTKESFIEYVWSIVKHLNPHLNNLYTYVEKKVNGVIIGESGGGKIYTEKGRTPNDPFPKKIKGQGINLFWKERQGEYHLVRCDVFPGDSFLINRLKKPFEITFAKLEQMISKGKIVTELPMGAQVHIWGLGKFKVQEEKYAVKASEKLLEIKDIIKVLNGEPSSLDVCRKVFQQYLANPTESLKQELKVAYEHVPEHERRYVGDMDVKDTMVRMIIYGDQEIENWSHYQVAEAMGEELPTIRVPKPKEEGKTGSDNPF